MNVTDALLLKDGDKVRVTYTPAPGHGPKINAPGTVRGVVSGKETDKYVWVCVYIPSQLQASCFASHFVSKL
ncbi:MAG: hypothetical protein UX12_C0028G0007 [Candidatus Collierbacteria bacterium GW2011_GWC1_45_47]|nr:MAG: hypothetical protein UX12_C0028G0007 [Candidatus Collierbacteria bacterium GW2011_GWC1_45_47]